MSDFTLNRSEQDSALWKRLEAHMKETREAYRVKNDGLLDQPATDRLRGRLAMLNELIELGQPGSGKTP